MRLLEPFTLASFRLKNRVVLSSVGCSTATMRARWQNSFQTAGLVLSTRLEVDKQAPPVSWDGTFARALRSEVKRIHASGGHAIAQLSCETGSDQAELSRHPHGTGIGEATLGWRRIERLLQRFAEMAAFAQAADFDGVEVHVFNASLADSLGPGETELLQEAVEAVGAVLGMSRVGARLCTSSLRDVRDHFVSGQKLFQVAASLDQLGLAWLHLVEPFPRGASALVSLRRYFGGAIIAQGRHTLKAAEKILDQGLADCVALSPARLADQSLAHPVSTIGSRLRGQASARCSM